MIQSYLVTFLLPPRAATSNSARSRQPVQPPGWSTLSELAYLDSVPNLFAIHLEAEYYG